MTKLKPCPFCGGRAVMTTIEPHTHEIAKDMPDYDGGTFIECSNCGAILSGEPTEEMIDKWNNRHDGWIPVSEKLPEKDGKYLCCTNRGSHILAKYYIFGNGSRWSTSGNVAKSIVAWQPLPERYREVEK